MSHLTKAAQDVGEAVETLRRAFNRFLEEAERSDSALRQTRQDVAAGLEREKQLRDMLRGAGLAAYPVDQAPNPQPFREERRPTEHPQHGRNSE